MPCVSYFPTVFLAVCFRFSEVQQPFVPLLIVAGLTVALAHGANDVGNAVGPLAVIVDVAMAVRVDATPEVPIMSLILGAVATQI